MEWLANLSIKWVLILAGLALVLRTVLIYAHGDRRRCAPTCDFLESALAALVLIFLVVRPFALQAYYIPSESMHPTLLEADRILVNKLIYRLVPPRRGELAVFRPPEGKVPEQKDYIKRIIGLPGETVEIVPERLLVDGHTLLRLTRESASEMRDESFQPELSLGYTYPLEGGSVVVGGRAATITSSFGPSLQVVLVGEDDEVRISGPMVYLNDRPLLAAVFGPITVTHNLTQWGGEPELEGTVFSANGTPRLILVRGSSLAAEPGRVLIDGRALEEPYIAEPPGYMMLPLRLRPKEYFMMGDNRNHSQDSHAWGPLPADRLIGRADLIFWPPSRFRVLRSPF